LDDRIEGCARRLAADAPPERVADLAQRCVSAKTFETLWIEKCSSASPAAWTVPSARTTQSPKRPGSIRASGGI